MRRNRRAGLAACCAILALLAAAPGLAQTAETFPDRPFPDRPFPDRPIRLIVPYAPGGATDSTARLLAGPLGVALGQSVVVENRTGGSGTIGAGLVVQARPDGHTLLLDPSAHAVNNVLVRNLPFDYERDFAPIARLAVMPLLMVVQPTERAPDLRGFIAAMQALGGRVNWASAGNGTASHLAGFLFARQAGIEGTHVPYRGGSQGAQAVVTGDTLFNFATTPSAIGLVQGGRLRALAVSGAARMALLPEVPTVAESALPGFALTEWIGVWAPVRTPEPVLDRLHAALALALDGEAMRSRFGDLGAEPALLPRAAFGRFVTEQRALLGRLASEAGIRPE